MADPNKLSLTGAALDQHYKSKPKQRQASGASAIQPMQNSGLPGTSGQRQMAPGNTYGNPSYSKPNANLPGLYNVPDKGIMRSPMEARAAARQQVALEQLGGPTAMNAAAMYQGRRDARQILERASNKLPGEDLSRRQFSPLAGQADFYSNSAANLKSQREAAMQRKTDQYNDWRAKRDADYRRRQAFGEEDPVQTDRNIAKLTAEFQAFQRAGGRMKFVDWMQAKIDGGEVSPYGMEADRIASNYNTRLYDDVGANSERRLANLDRYNERSAAAEERMIADKAARDDARAEAQQAGLARRQAEAAQEAEIRGRAVENRRRGISPAQTYAQAQQEEAINNYYGQMQDMANMQNRRYEIEAETAKANLEAQRRMNDDNNAAAFERKLIDQEIARDANQNARDLYDMESKSQLERDREKLRAEIEAENRAKEQSQKAYEEQYAAELEGDPADISTPRGRAMAKYRTGKDPWEGVKDIPAEERTPLQNKIVESFTIEEIGKMDYINPEDPMSLVTITTQVVPKTGVTPSQLRTILSSKFAANLNDPAVAENILANIRDDVRAKSIEAGRTSAGLVTRGDKGMLEKEQQLMKTYEPVIEMLKPVVGESGYSRVMSTGEASHKMDQYRRSNSWAGAGEFLPGVANAAGNMLEAYRAYNQ